MTGPAYAGVICHGGLVEGDPGCGRVDIDFEEYSHQMRNADREWRCPSCGNSACFDDDRFEEINL